MVVNRDVNLTSSVKPLICLMHRRLELAGNLKEQTCHTTSVAQA